MRGRRSISAGVLAAAVVAGAALLAASAGTAGGPGRPPSTGFSVFATGLLNPRGLEFGPGGGLFVAEGGPGGTTSTGPPEHDPPLCEQVPGPSSGSPTGPGPATGGFGARVSRIGRDGTRRTVVDGLPTSQTTIGASVQGVADVKFFDGQLYAITAGAGCSHGLAGTVNSLLRVNRNGTVTSVVNLSAYLAAHPPADRTFELNDWEPDGTWYSMVAARGALYAVEPNHQEIDRIDSRWHVTRVLDLSAQSVAEQAWIGPTSIVYHDGDFYFGTLSPFPIAPAAAVYRMTPSGNVARIVGGLFTVLGVAFDCRDRLYALESMTDTAIPFPAPNQIGSGKVVRINRDGSQTVVVEGLSFPTAMTFGPDGLLYISNFGFGAPTGEIDRANVGDGCGFGHDH